MISRSKKLSSEILSVLKVGNKVLKSVFEKHSRFAHRSVADVTLSGALRMFHGDLRFLDIRNLSVRKRDVGPGLRISKGVAKEMLFCGYSSMVA